MNKIKEEVHLGESEELKKKFDLSKLKELMNVDIKDITAKFSKNNKKNKYFKKSEKKKKVVAFDIGHTTIKIVEGIYYKENLSISKLVEITTPKGALSDGIIIKKEALISKLQKTLLENSINFLF